jgi:hypothetical protein
VLAKEHKPQRRRGQMKNAKWNQLDSDQRVMVKGWLEERYPSGVHEPTKLFKETQPCSCCGETGWVPAVHKFLCVFCWVAAPYFAEYRQDNDVGMKDNDGRGTDKVSTNIPIGIQGTPTEPNVYYTMTFNARDFTQDQLEAMIP